MPRSEEHERELSAAARRVFDACVDGAHVETFDNRNGAGFVIVWSLRGVGFGELTIARSHENGQWSVDDEAIDAGILARILGEAFPQGEVTRLELENVGSAITCAQLIRAFDEIDAHGKAAGGAFGSAVMNTLVKRYQAARAGIPRIP